MCIYACTDISNETSLHSPNSVLIGKLLQLYGIIHVLLALRVFVCSSSSVNSYTCNLLLAAHLHNINPECIIRSMASQAEGYDFASLPILDEGILLEGLRHRYERDSIYVSILCTGMLL